jgi:hypothetical protein
MIKKLLLVFIAIVATQSVFAQCQEINEERVLLVGDSWAFFMGVDGTFNNVFEKWGFSNYKFFTNSTLSENGARTTDFLKPSKLNEIKTQLQNRPTIDVVHLSIGGNDVLGNWNVNFTEEELDELVDEVYSQVLEIIDSIKSYRPGITIMFSGYTYPNFEEVIESAAPFQSSHPFYSTWSNMGFPSFLEINTILNDFSILIEDYVATDPQLAFVNATGILQYTFGQNTPLGVAPGGSYPPFTQPLPFGDPEYPSPQNSMRDYFLTKDCFHLSARGYRDMIGYQFQKYYHKFFMNNFLLSDYTVDASVTSSLNTDTLLKFGNEAGEEFATILHFPTLGADFGLYNKAEIFLRIESISGVNPLNGTMELSLKSGAFGASATVQGTDWNAPDDFSDEPCIFGKKENATDWIRIEIPAEMLPYITQTANTQFRLKSNQSEEGWVVFTNASDPEFAPVLNFKFEEPAEPNSVRRLTAEAVVNIYPNPAENVMNIEHDFDEITSLKIYDTMGRLCKEINAPKSNSINIQDLNSGVYSLQIVFGETSVMKQFVKQ